MYYDRKGKPMTSEEWFATFMDEGDPLRVELTEITPSVRVSTVWLGLDHSFGKGPPLIFESMVFDGTDETNNGDMRRYTTEEEARAGHAEMVAEQTKRVGH